MRSATRVKESKIVARHWVARVIGSLVAVAGLGLLAAAPAFAAATITVNVLSDIKPTDHREGVAYDGTNGNLPYQIATFIDSDACPTPLTCQPNSAFTATVRWGDTSTNTDCAPPYPAAGCDIVLIDSATGTYQITASHTYIDEFNCQPAPCLNYLVHVSVRDTVDAVSGAGDNSAGNGIAVKDQQLTGAPGTFSATSGVAFSGQIGSFQDLNPLAGLLDQGIGTPEYSLSIDWGDGSVVDTTGTLAVGTCTSGGCQVNVSGAHTYTNSNTYPVLITVQDGKDNQFKIQFTSTANVANDGGSRCTSANIVGTTASAPAGTTFIVSAGAGGCSAPQFQFWLQYPTNVGPWVIKQKFSHASTWTWNTDQLVPGPYKIVVWVNQTPSSNFEAVGVAYVTLTGCGASSASWSLPSPQPSGTNPIQLTASTTICSNARYQFWMLAPNSGTWKDVQAYSGNNILSWNTTDQPAGLYHFSVWVKDLHSGGINGNVLGRWDTSANTTYMLNVTRCTSVTVTSSPPNTTTVGNPVTFTATAVGCQFPLHEFWMLAPGAGTWKDMQAYGNANGNVFTWTTTGLATGSYRFAVWARGSGSPGNFVNTLGRWDTSFNLTYMLT